MSWRWEFFDHQLEEAENIASRCGEWTIPVCERPVDNSCIQKPVDNSVAEPLRVLLWRDYLFFMTRSFFVIEENRFKFQLNAIYLPPYFSNHSQADDLFIQGGTGTIQLEGPWISSKLLPHPADKTLVQLSAMTVSELPHSVLNNKDVAHITIGAKFWEEADRTRDFFSIYDFDFDPTRPINDRFILRHIPPPRSHPLEEANTRIGYTAGLTAFSNAKNGLLLHSTYRSHGFERLRFFLSVIGIDVEGKLYFAEIDEDFRKYLAANRNRCRVPIEEYSAALVFLAADTSTVDIWYPA